MAISAILVLLQLGLTGFCYSSEPVDIESLNTKVLELEIELLKLKNRVCEQEPATQDIVEIRQRSLQNGAAVTELRQDMLEHSSLMSRNVAFRSMLSGIITSASGQTIVFDHVAMNVGNAYNQDDGIFTAPYNGTYLFSMTLGNPTGKPGPFFMVQSVNTEREVIGYTIAGHTTGWNTGTLTTVTMLFIGDSVWVEGGGSAHGTYKIDRHHTSFSGALLHTQ